MNTSTRFITVVMAALGMTGISTGSAAAEAANGAMVPLSALFRSCDFTKLSFVSRGRFRFRPGVHQHRL